MPTNDEFLNAKLKLFDKIGYQNLNQQQRMAFMRIKHAENTWVRGGPAMEFEEPPYHIDNFCYRLPRPYLGSPKSSIVKEKIFDPIEEEKPPPMSYMRDLPRARGSTYTGHTYEYADTTIVPQGRVSISLRNGTELRPIYKEPSPQHSYTHESPEEYPQFYNRGKRTIHCCNATQPQVILDFSHMLCTCNNHSIDKLLTLLSFLCLAMTLYIRILKCNTH